MIILELIWGFFRVGLFTFGGGYAAIPLIRDVVLSYGWLSEAESTYLIAVCDTQADAEELVLSMAESEVYESYFYIYFDFFI